MPWPWTFYIILYKQKTSNHYLGSFKSTFKYPIYLIRKGLHFKDSRYNLKDVVTLLGTVPITPKNSMHFVKIVNQILVIGLTESGMSLLTIIEDEKIIKQFEDKQQIKNNSTNTFNNYLTKLMVKQHDK